jgi:hypothetical protein
MRANIDVQIVPMTGGGFDAVFGHDTGEAMRVTVRGQGLNGRQLERLVKIVRGMREVLNQERANEQIAEEMGRLGK